MALFHRPDKGWRRQRRKDGRERLEDRVADEVRDELGFHIEMRARELIAEGVPPGEARRRALRAFGRRQPIDQECRRLTASFVRRSRLLETLDSSWRDVRIAVRTLAHQPLFVTTAVLILALGIGSASVVYSLVDVLLLRSLPVAGADRLVALFNHTETGGYYSSVSYPDFLDYRERVTSLEDFIGYTVEEVTLSGGEVRPAVIEAHVVTQDYFGALGVAPVIGHGFDNLDVDSRGADPVVVIGHGLWQQRFAGDPGVLGTRIALDGEQATVIGVAPPDFRGLTSDSIATLWMPVSLHVRLNPGFASYLYSGRGAHWMQVVGHRAPGVTTAQVASEIATLSRQQAAAYPDSNGEYALRVFDAGSGVVWPDRRRDLVFLSLLLAVGVGLLLLIACANVANLMLSRASARSVELGVRRALGAGRSRLVRQLLTESAVLGLAGAAAGFLLAAWFRLAVILTIVPAPVAHLLGDGLDASSAAFALLVSIPTTTLFGLAPAWRATTPDLIAPLKGSGSPRRRRASLGNALVVAQIALSIPLLVSAALVVQSLRNQLFVDLGVRTDNLLLATIDPGSGGYSQADGEALYRRVIERVEALPGVAAASYAKVMPLGATRMATDARPLGGESGDADETVNVEVNVVGPGYAAAAGTVLLRGRDFAASDDAAGPPLVIVNEAMARRFWGSRDALGELIQMSWFDGPIEARVIGVLSDHGYGRIRDGRLQLQEMRPRVYMAMGQAYQPSMTLLVRASSDPTTASALIAAELRGLAGDLPAADVATFRQHVAGLLPEQRLASSLLAIASLIGLVVAAVGIYGVIAYSVARRRREMGIRRALGARSSDVLRLVIGEGLALAVFGAAAGLAAALAMTRLLSNLLYGIETTDPSSYAAVVAVVLAVAALAAWLPGRSAATSELLPALRRE